MLQNHSQVQVRRHWMNFFKDINILYKFESRVEIK